MLRRLVREGAQFRFVSNELLDQLLPICPELAPVSSVRPAAIDVSRAPTRRQARRELDLTSELLIVVIARLVPEKRVHAALNAAELLGPDHVVVVGDGPEREKLERRYPQVHFAGREAHVKTLTWLSAADLLISASREEGSPLAIREARALGVLVVSCRAGDLDSWARYDSDLWLTGA
jgi:glycosyltransferase involved in cell wall biosynthesis